MSVHKHVDIGEEFDALLRSELSVEPSPAFLPRVRGRIAAMPQRTWRFQWLLAGTAAAVCVLAIAGEVFYRSSTLPPASAPVPQLTKVPDQPTGAGLDPPQQRTSTRAPGRRRGVTSPRAVVATAEVIVDQRQRAALSALMKMIDNGRITDKAFAQTKPQTLDPIKQHIVPVGVVPVAVNSLEFDGVLQKGTERK